MSKEQHELKKIDWPVIPIMVYRGCLVTKIIGGYTIFGRKCKTESEVDAIIDKSYDIIKNSLNAPEDNNIQ